MCLYDTQTSHTHLPAGHGLEGVALLGIVARAQRDAETIIIASFGDVMNNLKE